MKSSFFYKFTLSIILIFCIYQNGHTQNIFTRNITKTFDTSPGNILKINNKYGDINITNWEKDNILIVLTISIEDINKNRADKLHSHIHKYIAKTANTIKAETKLNKAFKTTNDFKISYEIKMPSYIQVQLNNKFGNISIESINALSDINLHYGNLSADFISKSRSNKIGNINLVYSKAQINTCERSKINLSFSELKIKDSQDLYITSKSSKINISNNNSIILDSKSDFYKIENINSLSISSANKSKFDITYLNKKLETKQKYGRLNIEKLNRFFSTVKLNMEYVNCSINTEERSEYILNISNKHTKITYTKDGIYHTDNNSEMNDKITFGESITPSSILDIRSQYSNITIN